MQRLRRRRLGAITEPDHYFPDFSW